MGRQCSKYVASPEPNVVCQSQELLDTWNKRERGLIDAHKDANGKDPVPAVALPPEPKGAYVGQDLSEDVRKRVFAEGARTIPGREHGGNCDIKK